MFTDFICIKDGSIVLADITIDLILNKFYKKFEEEIREKVTRKVNQFFNLSNWDYAKNLKENDLIKYLSEIKEISRFDINFTTDDENNGGNLVRTKFYEIIRTDTINITFSYE